MLKMVNILRQKEFRTGVESAIRTNRVDYALPTTIPTLYRYCGFSKYAVDNIRNNGLSLSLIASYNDCYDSSISFGDIWEMASKEYAKDLRIFAAAGVAPVLSIDDWHGQIATAQKVHRGFLNDSHCCSFSQSASSTLMWSHYANNNRGICIGYNFETIHDNPFYYSLFPVAYTDKPINVYDYAHEENGALLIETGLLVSFLNKARCWEYEKEWRLVMINESFAKHRIEKHPTFNDVIKAESIILGQHFLDNFIPELNRSGIAGANEALELLRSLAVFLRRNGIPVYQAIAKQDTFDQYINSYIDLDKLIQFIEEQMELEELSLPKRNYLYISFYDEFFDVN